MIQKWFGYLHMLFLLTIVTPAALAASLTPTACPGSSSSDVIFVFEGAGGYCPTYAALHLRDPSGNLYHSAARYSNESAEQWIMNCSLIARIVELQSQVPIQKIHYFSWWQIESARACFQEIHQKSGGQFKLKIMGYSMGGGAATQLAQELSSMGFVGLDHVLTLDPVPQAERGRDGLLTPEEQSPFIRASLARRWENFYQRLDRASLAIRGVTRGIQGFPVWGADTNTKLTLDDYPFPVKKHHAGLLKTPKASAKMVELLQADSKAKGQLK